MGLETGTIALIVASSGAVVGAYGAYAQGQAQKQQMNYQAAIQRQQAERERQLAENREEDFRRNQSRMMARRRAVLGSSGVEAAAGSPLLVSEDFASEIELQALRTRNTGEVRATRLEQQASLSRMAGANAASAGRLRAGASLLQGIGQAQFNYAALE